MAQENKIKLLEVIPTLDSGGAERFVVDLANELSKNLQVILVVFFPLNTYNHFLSEVSDNVKIVSLNKKSGFDISIMIKLIWIIFKEKPNYVHSHVGALNYLLLCCILFRKTKFFHTLHNDAHIEGKGFLSMPIRKFLFRLKLCSPITISGESQLSFKAAYKLESKMIKNGRTVTHSLTPVCYRNIKKNENTTVLLNIARIEEQKNQIMLATSVSQLIKEGYDLALVIIGRKSDTGIVKKIEALNCMNIHLIGEVSNPIDYLTNCGAFCLSSLYEGMPITLIEAFSAGVIPICTPVGGVKNMIIHKENGLLSSDNTIDSYKEILKEFLNLSPSEIENLKKASLASFNKYSIEECSKNYQLFFEK